jgi:histone chaperone ASF1
MALVNVTNVIVLNNPSNDIRSPFEFEITFECLQELQDDLEWKIIYVGNAEDSTQDQVLEEVMVGPVQVGICRFPLSSPAPDYSRIANEDLIGVTVLIISCSYVGQEFLKIGYYVANEYTLEYDPENPPNPVSIDLLRRNIGADQPRVTRIPIDWQQGINENVPYEQAEVNVAEDVDIVDFDNAEVEDDLVEEIDDEQNDDIDIDEDEGESNGDEENDINLCSEDIDMISGNEDSMDVANMQNHNFYAESN